MRETAIRIIEEAFKGKKDRGGNDYILHLYRVANKIDNYIGSDDYRFIHTEEIQSAAYLHDLIKDCPEYTFELLEAIIGSKVVIDIVRLLTKIDDIEYDQYIKNIGENRYATIIKLCDLEDNMDITRLKKITDKDLERLKKYHKSYTYLISKL